MPQLLEKLNTRLLIFLLGGVLAVGILVLCILLLLKPQPQAQPDNETTAPTASLPEENPFGPEDFVTDENGFISCLAGDYKLGIDVSGHQGQIDWSAVRDAGVEFVFIRVGNRGTTEGGIYADASAQDYYAGAKAAGLQVGAYFFSQAVTPAEAQEEAQFVITQVQDWELDLPVVYDWEWVDSTARTADVTGQLLTHCTQVFCESIEKAGLTPMIYFNYSQGLELLDLAALSQYPFWLALYEPYIDFPHRVDFWQYSCTGSIPGIDGDVDLNLLLPEV